MVQPTSERPGEAQLHVQRTKSPLPGLRVLSAFPARRPSPWGRGPSGRSLVQRANGGAGAGRGGARGRGVREAGPAGDRPMAARGPGGGRWAGARGGGGGGGGSGGEQRGGGRGRPTGAERSRAGPSRAEPGRAGPRSARAMREARPGSAGP